MTPEQVIDKLITEAQRWRREHMMLRRYVETLACDIRIRALRDARDAITKESDQ